MRQLLKISCILLATAAINCPAAETIVPYNNSAWIHGYMYDKNNTMTFSQSAFFLNKLKAYNADAKPGHRLTALSVYGATIEIGKPKNGDYTPNNFNLTYYPSRRMSKITNNWDSWVGQLDAGFRSVHDYARLTVDGKPNGKRVLNLIDISGVVGHANSHGTYLLNGLDQTEAANLADYVAGQVCADDVVDGVVFDLEPFSFSDDTGVVQGYGQKYFYTRIAQDFAGHYNNAKIDPLHCVDPSHGKGRIFAIFTSGQTVQDNADEIASVLTQYGNGYIIFGLYDINDNPAVGTAVDPETHAQDVQAEVLLDKRLADDNHFPYQFAIAASASSTQLESFGGNPTGYNQIDYVKADINAINANGVRQDPLFKGMMLFEFGEMSIGRNPEDKSQLLNLEPADPFSDKLHAVVPYLQQNL